MNIRIKTPRSLSSGVIIPTVYGFFRRFLLLVETINYALCCLFHVCSFYRWNGCWYRIASIVLIKLTNTFVLLGIGFSWLERIQKKNHFYKSSRAESWLIPKQYWFSCQFWDIEYFIRVFYSQDWPFKYAK